MDKLKCKVPGCDFKAKNLEPHITQAHADQGGIEWYVVEFDADVNDIVHHSLLKESEKKVDKSATSVTIGSVTLPVRKGDSTFVPKFNPAYHFAEHAADVAQDILENKRILLVGHTGTGKTSLIEQIAARTNNNVIRSNMNGQTTIGDFVGMWTVKGGETVWVDGVLPLAMKAGYWLVIDELGFAEAAILSVLQYVLEQNGKLVLKEKGHEVIEPHPDFRLFATDNAAGCMQEFRALYQGCNLMNEAFLDRWHVYHVDYLPPEEEAKVIAATHPRISLQAAKYIVRVAGLVRESFAREELSCTFSLRRLMDWGEKIVRYANMPEYKKRATIKAAESTIFSKVSKQDADIIRAVIERTMKQSPDRS